MEEIKREIKAETKAKSRRELAEGYFLQGYNCTQSIMMAFLDLIDEDKVDHETLLAMASSFGGGMGRLREVCGSVSGMFLIAGYVHGYSGPETGQIKADHYAMIQELAHRFEAQHGSIVCRELLGLHVKEQTPVPEARTTEYYKKRPCKEIIGSAAQILDDYLKETEHE